MDDRTRALAIERFLIKVDKNGAVSKHRPDLGRCWIWKPQAGLGGYGSFYLNGKGTPSHRASYTLLTGPIPAGLVIDHLCRVRNCVNPAHLEAVATAENTRRAKAWMAGAEHQRSKTHCPYGHPYSGDNLHIAKDGKRVCVECSRRYSREARERKRAANPPKPRPVKEFCLRGHSLAEYGVVFGGKRRCGECDRLRMLEYRERRRAEREPHIKATCKHGHPWVEENIYVNPRGQKSCRTCHNSRTLARYYADKATRPDRPLRTECRNGHDLTGDNAYVMPDGVVKCRECATARRLRYEAKIRAALPPKELKPPRIYCKWGHELAGANLYIDPHGRKFCRRCTAMYQARRKAGIAKANPAKGKNMATHCPAGHEYAGENLITQADGTRKCRECQRARSREYMRAKRAAATS